MLLVSLLLVGLLLAPTAAAQNAYSASEDGTVRKIDDTGTEVWSFPGAGNQFLTVAVDADGNVYAGDEKGNVFKINSTGSQVWSFTISGQPKALALTVDGEGNVYVGDENGDVTKLDTTGSMVWSATPSGGAKVLDVSPDGDGNVYAGTEAKEVVKLNSTGATLWKSTAPDGQVLAVAVNPAGDVFAGDEKGEILKIDASGSQVWALAAHSNKVFGLAFDGKGSLYSASEDKTVKKIDPSGPTEVWSFADPDGKKAFGVAIDSAHHVHYGSESSDVHKLETDGSGTIWTFSGHTQKVFGISVDPGAFTMSTDGTAPTVASITTLDRDGDGKVDAADVVFSEAIDDSTISPGDWSIGGTAVDAFSTTVGGDADADDEKIQLQITTDGDEISGTDAKDVTYTQGTTADRAGHKLADVASGDIDEADGAKPVVSSITTRDRDADGKVDAADVVFSEAIDDATVTPGDWSIEGTSFETVNTTVDGDADADDEKVQLRITTAADEISGTDVKDVTYAQGTTADLAGNLLADVASGDVGEADGAEPTITDLEIFDTADDGLVDEIVVTFSEDVDTDDGAAPVASDFGTLTLPDGSTADLSSATFTDPAGTSATVTISGIAGQSTPNTATGATDIAGDLSANWTDGAGNALVSTLDDETVTDSAAPVQTAIASRDTDGDGTVDRIDVTYSESLSGSAEIGDYALGGTDAGNVSLDSVAIDGSTVQIDVTGPENATGLDLTMDYDRTAGTSDSITDGTNAAPSFNGASVSDAAAPQVKAITTRDTDGDGRTDAADVVFTEAIDDGTITPGDWSIEGTPFETVNTTVDGDTDADDEKIQLRITTDGNEISGTDAKDVTYAQGATADLAGNLLADVASGDVTETAGNVAPSADFSFSPSEPTTEDTVAFADQSTDSDGTIASRSWEFGDGATSTAQDPSHSYAEAGDYTVNLTVTDDGGVTNTTSRTITVSTASDDSQDTGSEPDPHILEIDVAPRTLEVGGNVTVRALVENRGGSGSMSIAFDIDTGTRYIRSLNLASGERGTVSLTKTIARAGTYQVHVEGISGGSFEVLAASDDGDGGAGASDIRLAGVDISPDGVIRPGDPVTVTLHWTNEGNATGERRYNVALDGETVAEGSIAVDPGETVSRNHTLALPRPGTFELTLDGEPVGTLTVEEDGRTTVVPGFGTVAAAIVLGVVAAVLARRR